MEVGYLANDKMAPAQFQTQDLWREPARGQPEGLTLSHRWTWGINLMDSYTDLSSNHSFAWTANSSDFEKKKNNFAGDDIQWAVRVKKPSSASHFFLWLHRKTQVRVWTFTADCIAKRRCSWWNLFILIFFSFGGIASWVQSVWQILP